MELFHSAAATSIRTRDDDLAFSALPNAPVQPFEPRRTRFPRRASVTRSRNDRSNGLLGVFNRLTNRPKIAECTNIHSAAQIQARIAGWRE